MNTLTVDPETHIYYRNGVAVPDPSVTGVLTDVGLRDDRYDSEIARSRGAAVHAACHFYDLGRLDQSTLHDDLRPYLTAWIKFRSELPVEWTAIEQPLYSPIYRCVGTPDRLGGVAVYDIKTGVPQDWHGYQLAAYATLAFPPSVVAQRYGVYLRDNGLYDLRPYRDRNDYTIWSSALNVYHAKPRR